MTGMSLDGAIIAATPVPFDASLAIDEGGLRSYLRWVAATGVTGIAVNADSGEGVSLSRAERARVIEIAVEECAGSIDVVAGLPAAHTAQAVELARDAAERGASALLVFPLLAYLGEPLPPELPYRYHATLADAVTLPQILFQMPKDLGGVFYDDGVLDRMLSVAPVAGIKDASFDGRVFVRTLQRVKRIRPSVAVLTGNDTFLRESFVLGADGALIGFGAIAGEQVRALREAISAGDLTRAAVIADSFQPLAEAIYAHPLRDARSRLKTALNQLGVFPSRAVRPPLLPIDEGEARKIRASLEALTKATVA